MCQNAMLPNSNKNNNKVNNDDVTKKQDVLHDSSSSIYKSLTSISSTDDMTTKTTTHLKNSNNKRSQDAIIPTLSLVWFTLCTSLVVKHNDLVLVFYSFAGSFLAVMAAAWILGHDDPRSALNHFFHNRAAYVSLSDEQKSNNCKSKSIVGMTLCFLSFLHLFEKIHVHKSPDFHALANISGFLAFDLWYDQVFCRMYPPQLVSIMENAVTLSFLSVILSKWDDWDVSSWPFFGHFVAFWLGYKMIRLGMDYVQRKKVGAVDMDAKVVVSTSGNLWTIHGNEYDLSDFVKRHPGGEEAILLGRGRDCTALFESYHPFTNHHRNVLKKYKPKNTTKSKVTTQNENESVDQFYEILKERVTQTLIEKGIDPNLHRAATPGRAAYYCLIIGLLIFSGSYHIQGNPFGSFMFAIFGWLVGCLGHDAGHFAASRLPFFNDLGLWGISFLCNPIMWQHQHTFAHHSHTNDFDHDPDLHHFDVLLRVHKRFKQRGVYKYQKNVFYVLGAYALVVFGECIKIPLGMMKTGYLYDMVEYTDRNRLLRAFGMYFHYISYLALIVVAPFFSGKSCFTALSCGLIHIITAGWLFALFSQINHLNEFSIDIQRGKTDSKLLRDSWAARQVATSNNFATKSLFWHVFSNGLNMQIEHHLFPGLNHCHLHLIQPTVERTCKEFGVHYKSFESWSEVMAATLMWLDKLSEASP